MRESCTSGSEGGAGQTNAPSLPLSDQSPERRTEWTMDAGFPRNPTDAPGKFRPIRVRRAAEAVGPRRIAAGTDQSLPLSRELTFARFRAMFVP